MKEDKPKIVWDYDFQTDPVIENQRPDLVILNTIENECQIMDVITSAANNMAAK